MKLKAQFITVKEADRAIGKATSILDVITRHGPTVWFEIPEEVGIATLAQTKTTTLAVFRQIDGETEMIELGSVRTTALGTPTAFGSQNLPKVDPPFQVLIDPGMNKCTS